MLFNPTKRTICIGCDVILMGKKGKKKERVKDGEKTIYNAP
jgi:hypothetical protein